MSEYIKMSLNPKSQYLNPKQYLNPNFPNPKPNKFVTLEFRICLEIRISDLEFRILRLKEALKNTRF